MTIAELAWELQKAKFIYWVTLDGLFVPSVSKLALQCLISEKLPNLSYSIREINGGCVISLNGGAE